MKVYDFSGWATRNNLKCSDGRTILNGAFKHNDGKVVPLVWGHQIDDISNILGNASLEYRDEGVYAYCKLNNSEKGLVARELVQHGDIRSLSIYANRLKQNGSEVVHGDIKEVSLVLAGANPGAFIDTVIQHDEEHGGEAIIYTDEPLDIQHADSEEGIEEEENMKDKKDEGGNETIKDVFNTLTEKQKNVVYYMLGQAIEDTLKEENEEKMKHNLFDGDQNETNTLSHSDIKAIFDNAKRCGSLREAVIDYGINEEALTHEVKDEGGNTVKYGVANINYMFPDARLANSEPTFVSRDMEWVDRVINGAKHLPFSRVKSLAANITMDEARAKGYIKGKEKSDEVFALLKRTTSPITIYKKQKLDRDDIVDIVDFDIVMWLKREMRIMLNEEIARAALVGDGRLAGTDDKISEDCIRPIWTDNDVYSIKKQLVFAPSATDSEKAKEFIKAAIKSRKDYKGSGTPTLFTTEDMLTDCLMIEDTTGRFIYDTIDKLKTALRVSDIVTVPVMSGLKRHKDSKNYAPLGIIVNLSDYSFGADKGGAVNLFDDFDIDYNQEKYLIETRCSGALTKPYSAIAIEAEVSGG